MHVCVNDMIIICWYWLILRTFTKHHTENFRFKINAIYKGKELFHKLFVSVYVWIHLFPVRIQIFWKCSFLSFCIINFQISKMVAKQPLMITNCACLCVSMCFRYHYELIGIFLKVCFNSLYCWILYHCMDTPHFV